MVEVKVVEKIEMFYMIEEDDWQKAYNCSADKDPKLIAATAIDNSWVSEPYGEDLKDREILEVF